jgi:hypothetical protein
MTASLTEVGITPLLGDGERVGVSKRANPCSGLDPIVTDLVDAIAVTLGTGRMPLLLTLL